MMLSIVTSPIDELKQSQEFSQKYQDLYQIVQNHQYSDELMMMGCVSPHCYDLLMKYWRDIKDNITNDNDLKKITVQYIDGLKANHDIIAIRQYKGKIFLLIAIMDYLALENMDMICQFISQTANIICQKILHIILLEYCQKRNISIDDKQCITHGICIYAMGKLGANMLNYSSDIDIIFLYDEDSIYLSFGNPSSLLRHIVTEFIDVMGKQDTNGRLFRVDIRLSPDNGVMPYAISYNSALNYYGSIARPWERMAMMKAKPIAGDINMGQNFLKEISPFIWRREIDLLAHQEVVSIRQKFHEFYDQQSDDIRGLDIKHCYGGIRDIEFALQLLQMTWAGRLQDLKTPILKDIFVYARYHGLLSQKQLDILSHGYWQLRRIEHHLQMKHDQQSYKIERDDNEILKFIYSLGYHNYDDFEQMLADLLGQTSAICHEFYDEIVDHNIFDFSNPDEQELSYTLLRDYGYNNPKIIYDYIIHWYGYPMVRSEKARLLLRSLLPKLLRYIAQTPQYEDVIRHFDHILSQLNSGLHFFILLDHQEQFLKKFCDLLVQLRFLSEQIIRDQSILDILIRPIISDYEYHAIDDYFKSTQQYARDDEEIFILYIRKLQELRLAISCEYITQLAPQYDFSYYLTQSTDIALKHIINHAIDIYQPIPNKTGFVIIALGSWGSYDMSLYSDLDMMLVYDHDDVDDYDLPLYYNRLATKIIGYLQMSTKYGKAFHVDMRLRPDSINVPLATSLERFCNYYLSLQEQSKAWVAEYHALENARISYASRQSSHDKIQQKLKKIHNYDLDKAKLFQEAKELIVKTRQFHHQQNEPQYKQWIKEYYLLKSFARRASISIDTKNIDKYYHILKICKHHYQFYYGHDYDKHNFLDYCIQHEQYLKQYLPNNTPAFDIFFSQLNHEIDGLWQECNIDIE